MALYPLGKEVADDGFRSGPDDVGFLKFLAAGDGYDGKLRGEAFDVLCLLLEKALGDEEREINVLVSGGFEAGVELTLQDFPDGVTVWLDNHAAFDYLGGLRHVALEDNVLIPGGEIFFAGSDG